MGRISQEMVFFMFHCHYPTDLVVHPCSCKINYCLNFPSGFASLARLFHSTRVVGSGGVKARLPSYIH